LLEHHSQRKEDPIPVLQRADALDSDLIAAHAIHLNPDEIKLLARRGVGVAHCPLSNMRLASGVMQLPAIRAAGIPVGLGLDGGTNDTSDMFNNMRVALGLQRARSLKSNVFPGISDVLWLATMGGAKVLKMDDQIGSLTPGKKADLIILDPKDINFGPRMDWLSQIVFNGQPRNIEWVFVDGRALKARGEIVGMNPDSLMSNVEKAAKKIRKFLNRNHSLE
jgi:5-methylthioadenosine/S-adenosylhomocysteine deaminase